MTARLPCADLPILTEQSSKSRLRPLHRAFGPQEPGTPAQREADESRPLYFGHEDRTLFGWLHATASVPASGVGLLICNPFGNEAVCAHRSIRHIAEQARLAGIPALRFDYDGTGDSAGDDHDPQRVAAWQTSIHVAVDELKRSSGVERVCLLGIRLGATLAAMAATERNDIMALIAIAPVASGKAYLREMRLLRRAMEARSGQAGSAAAETLEAGGFVLSAETQADLARLDLNVLESAPAPRVLVLDRAEMPGDPAWTRRLQEDGVRVVRASVTGYPEMMLDCHENVVPREMIATAFDWLQGITNNSDTLAEKILEPSDIGEILERSSGHPVPPRPAPPDTSGARPAVIPDVREWAVRFGDTATLFGIVTTPRDDRTKIGSDKGVILLSAGAVHHIGPGRLYVTVARHLARQGYTVLRMDISGIGDSPPQAGVPENIVYSKHAVEEIRAALDYLRRDWDVTEVHVAGLCSGAYNSFKAAVAHLPLSGVVLINPLTFSWKDGMSLAFPEHRVVGEMMRYRANALRLGPWLKLLRGDVNVLELMRTLALRFLAITAGLLRSVARGLRIPLRDDLPTQLKSIVRARIRLRFIFADTDPGLEMLDDLGGATARRLRERGKIGVETITDADHTFTDGGAREKLVEALARSLSRAQP